MSTRHFAEPASCPSRFPAIHTQLERPSAVTTRGRIVGLTKRLEVRSFGTALIAALVMSLLGKLGVYAMNLAMSHRHPGSIYI